MVKFKSHADNMHIKRTPGAEYSQSLHWSDTITALYLTLYILLLYSNYPLLKLWSFDHIYLIATLSTLEVLKYIVYVKKEGLPMFRTGIKDFFNSLLVLSLIFVTIYVTAVLFGAPVMSMFHETSIFAATVTSITALPACLHLGHKSIINMFLSLMSSEPEINMFFMLKTRLSLFGAWAGAIVIPLDWNRPWQDWPIPCCVGTVVGYMMANFITSVLQWQQRGRSKKTGKYIL